MPQTEQIEEMAIQQVVPSSQLDVDPIDYASSMTSTYQHDEIDEGKNF